MRLLGMAFGRRPSVKPVVAVPSVDHLDEAGLESLRVWADDIQARIGHADTKASILLGLSGTALALLPGRFAALGGGATFARLHGLHLIAGLAGLLGLALLGACVIVLILAVRPSVSGIGIPVYGSFVGAGTLSAEQILFLAAEPRQHPAAAALRVALLARIAARKHARVRSATTLLLAAVGPLSVCAVLGVVGR